MTAVAVADRRLMLLDLVLILMAAMYFGFHSGCTKTKLASEGGDCCE
jgi:hypothetical protein